MPFNELSNFKKRLRSELNIKYIKSSFKNIYIYNWEFYFLHLLRRKDEKNIL